MIMVRVQSYECSSESVGIELVVYLRGYYRTIQPLFVCSWTQVEPFRANSGHCPPHWTPDLGHIGHILVYTSTNRA